RFEVNAHQSRKRGWVAGEACPSGSAGLGTTIRALTDYYGFLTFGSGRTQRPTLLPSSYHTTAVRPSAAPATPAGACSICHLTASLPDRRSQTRNARSAPTVTSQVPVAAAK